MQPFHREVVVENEFVEHYLDIHKAGVRDATVVGVKVGGNWFMGAALCSETDEFKIKTGYGLARGRAVRAAYECPEYPDLRVEQPSLEEIQSVAANYLNGELCWHEYIKECLRLRKQGAKWEEALGIEWN